MQFKSVKILIGPLLKGGKQWQNIDINGYEAKPRFYFSNIQWCIIILSIALQFKLTTGISKDIVGYVMSAFSISVSLFMSLLVSIFDKFENTKFDTQNKPDAEIDRLKQKKNFFKKFISITSYLVVLSILIIILCSLTYIFNLSVRDVSPKQFTLKVKEIDWILTTKNSIMLVYRVSLDYFLLNYLHLTFFIAGSAYDYYMSELNKVRIS